MILSTSLVWLGLFLGVEQTAHWTTPFEQPGLTMSTVALVGVGKVGVRVVYLQPLQRDGYGPALQFGVSVKVF